MKRTVIALVAAYAVQYLLAQPWALAYPAPEWSAVMISVDFVAATLILLHPAGKMQALIGLTFVPQIGFHFGRVLNGGNADIDLYWWGLSILGIMQLLLLAGWFGHGRFIRYRDRHYGSDLHPQPVAARPRSLDG